jgi:hypothetical protein
MQLIEEDKNFKCRTMFALMYPSQHLLMICLEQIMKISS